MIGDGEAEAAPDSAARARSGHERRRVFLVHGRDMDVRQSLINLLRSLDLRVVSWDEAVAHTGTATPYTGDVVSAGMNLADAVVVLLTPDDLGRVQTRFRQDRDGPEETQLMGQARLNVVFEAGMAMARDRAKVVLVEVGVVRPMTDTAGLNVVRLTNDINSRRSLALRLRVAGLDVDLEHDDWRTAGDFTQVSPVPEQTQNEDSSSIRKPVPVIATGDATGPSDDTTISKSRVREMIRDSTQAATLEDLVESAADKAAAAASSVSLVVSGSGPTRIDEVLTELSDASEPLLRILAFGVTYDRSGMHSDLWIDALSRLLRARTAPTGIFQDHLERLRHYPALLAMRTIGLAAVQQGADGLFIRVHSEVTWRDWSGERRSVPAAVALHDYNVLSPDVVNMLPRWDGTRWLYPCSHLLRVVLRPIFGDVLADDDDYKWACDRYEYRLALLQQRLKNQRGALKGATGEFMGDFQWGSSGKLQAQEDFEEASARASNGWPWWSVVPRDELATTLETLRQDLEQRRRYG